MSDIDTTTANLFARFCGCYIILKLPTPGNPRVLDAKVSSLSGEIGNNSLQKYGLGYDQVSRLQEYDLVSSELNSKMPYGQSIVSPTSKNVEIPFYYQNKPYALRQLEDNRDQIKDFQMSGVRLTAVGIELYAIVDFVASEKYFEDFKTHLNSQKLQLEPVIVMSK